MAWTEGEKKTDIKKDMASHLRRVVESGECSEGVRLDGWREKERDKERERNSPSSSRAESV